MLSETIGTILLAKKAAGPLPKKIYKRFVKDIKESKKKTLGLFTFATTK